MSWEPNWEAEAAELAAPLFPESTDLHDGDEDEAAEMAGERFCPDCDGPLDAFNDCPSCKHELPAERRAAAIALQLERAGTHPLWAHAKYGRATVMAVSRLSSTGQLLVTVRYSQFGQALAPAPVTTYTAEDFWHAFAAADA